MALKAGRAGLRSELVTPDGRLTESAVQVATATKSKKGIVKIGDGINVNSGTISVPVATASAVGSVKAVTKTDGMTKEVGVDADGKLWVEPSEGGGGIKEGDTVTIWSKVDSGTDLTGLQPDFENMKLRSGPDTGTVTKFGDAIEPLSGGLVAFWNRYAQSYITKKAYFITNGITDGSDILWAKIFDKEDGTTTSEFVGEVDFSELGNDAFYILGTNYNQNDNEWRSIWGGAGTSKIGVMVVKHPQTIQ